MHRIDRTDDSPQRHRHDPPNLAAPASSEERDASVVPNEILDYISSTAAGSSALGL